MKLLENRCSVFVALGASTFLSLGVLPPLSTTPTSTIPSTLQGSCFGTCTAVPAPCTPQEFHYQWGGTIRGGAFRHRNSTSTDNIWTSEDGGRVRVSTNDGASFSEQETPREVKETLRSIQFLRLGEYGWGISEDGYVVATQNGGDCWKTLSQITYLGNPAELWDIHFLNSTTGFVAGEHVLKKTIDGGCTWTDEALSLPSGMTLADVEFYALDSVQDTGGAFVALVACEPGLIMRRTDTSSTWSVVMRHDSINASNNIPNTLQTPACCAVSPCTCNTVVEVWDVEFSPQSSMANAVAFACSGVGNGCGVIYRGTAGGTSWAA